MKSGRARRIVKPGQVFNRIHVDDLADIIDGAVRLALTHGAGGVFNAADDEPTAPGDPIAFAAGLLGVAPPPEIPFEEAKKTMSPFAVSFYGETKRVRNARIKSRARRDAALSDLSRGLARAHGCRGADGGKRGIVIRSVVAIVAALLAASCSRYRPDRRRRKTIPTAP